MGSKHRLVETTEATLSHTSGGPTHLERCDNCGENLEDHEDELCGECLAFECSYCFDISLDNDHCQNCGEVLFPGPAWS